MKILFLFSITNAHSVERPLFSYQEMQFGISYISSFLKSNGYMTKLVVLNSLLDEDGQKVDRVVADFNPDIVCAAAVFSEYGLISRMAKRIRSTSPSIYQVIGGVHASLNPDSVIQDGYDALCVGEGEYPMLELVAQLEQCKVPAGIPNMWFRHGDKIEKNPTMSFIADLNSLPFPDREMWEEWVIEDAEEKRSLLLGRGCPFECTYCCNHALRKISNGRYVRYRGPENITAEIAYLINRFPKTVEVYLEIETACSNRNWFFSVCEELESLNRTLSRPLSFGVNFRITPRADLESLFAACKRANFRFINIGLESGSERVRRDILKRNYSNQDVSTAVMQARKNGLGVSLFNLIGIPGETLNDFWETIKVNRLCQPDWHSLSIFFPYPGTKLYTICKEMGLLTESLSCRRERTEASLDLPGFSRRQIRNCYIWFDFYVYRGFKPFYLLLAIVLSRAVKSRPYVWKAWRRLSRSPFIHAIKKPYIRLVAK